MKKNSFDKYLFFTALILLVFGILFLSGVSAIFSQQETGKSSYYFFHQIIWGIIPGAILGFIFFKINLGILKKGSFLIVLAGIFLMVLVFIPGLGIISGGAPRWLNMGGLISFQPSEFLKLFFIFYLSALLEKYTDKKTKNWSSVLIAFLIIIGVVSLLLVLQSDVSTLGIIAVTGIIMYFSASTPVWHSLLIILISVGSFFVFIITSPYRLKRFQVLLGIIKDPMGLGYQIKQILITVGSGGVFGIGLGGSSQKFGFVPQTMSDSIFAIIAEETGFVGSAVLIILFLFFLWRGFVISKKAKDGFLQLLAVGITSWISIQALVNIGAMIRILPLTGIPLPFISYGGSHLLVELAAVGILLNISRSDKIK